MTTNNHTPIPASPTQAANAATINSPLSELDTVITAHTTKIGTAASVSGTLGTAIDTDGTLKAGAVDGSTILADTIVTDGKLATDVKVGSLAALTTVAKSSVQAALNEHDARIQGQNLFYSTDGTITWDATKKQLAFSSNLRIFHGDTGGHFSSTSGGVTINFGPTDGGITGGNITTYGYAYLETFTPGVNKLNYVQADVKYAAYSAPPSKAMLGPDIILLAEYNGVTAKVQSPFFLDKLETAYTTDQTRPDNYFYTTDGAVTWDATKKQLTFAGTLRIFHGRTAKFSSSAAGLVVNFGPTDGAITGANTSSYCFAYLANFVPGVNKVNYAQADVAYQDYNVATIDLQALGYVVIATYNTSTGKVWTPFVSDRTLTDWLTTPTGQWTNLYPQIISRIPHAAQALMAGAADFKLLLWGDSLFARGDTCSAVTDATVMPPTLTHKNIMWWLWQSLQYNKAVYRRYDYTAYFAFTGSWTPSRDDANWDDAYQARSAWTDFSTATNAAFAWTLGTTDDESGCNLIYRTDTAGDAAAPVTVAEGNGYLEYWTGAAWAEANGATINMLETDEGAYNGNTRPQQRLKLRKAAAHLNDSVTVTVSKASADTDRLLFYGVELYDAKNAKPILQIINSGRGSNTLASLGGKIEDDVYNFTPNLVLVEIPLVNMITADPTKAGCANDVWDWIWGDRPDHTNSEALFAKAQSGGSGKWDLFEVILMLPPYIRAWFNTDGTWAEVAADVRACDIYGAVKAVILAHGDVGMLDLGAALLREIDKDPMYLGQYYNALASNGVTGLSYASDGTHPNNRGVALWARHLCPILDINTW